MSFFWIIPWPVRIQFCSCHCAIYHNSWLVLLCPVSLFFHSGWQCSTRWSLNYYAVSSSIHRLVKHNLLFNTTSHFSIVLLQSQKAVYNVVVWCLQNMCVFRFFWLLLCNHNLLIFCFVFNWKSALCNKKLENKMRWLNGCHIS